MKIRLSKKYVAYLAIFLSVALSSFWSFWGINEFFHEGWYAGSIFNRFFLFFGQYMFFAIVFTVISLFAIKYRKTGLVVYILLGIFSAFFFSGGSFQVVYLFLAIPFVLLGLLFYFGEFINLKIIKAIILIPPILIVLLFGPVLFYRNINRIDDGNYGERLLDCQGLGIVWASRGPGFPDKGANWNDAVAACEYLSESGEEALVTKQNIWRLPSVEEAVMCQMSHNENAGGIWNKESGKAEYLKKPDKETPLWQPNSEIVYYWTSESSPESAGQAYIFTYDGNVFDKDINFAPNTQSFRCVKDYKNNDNIQNPKDEIPGMPRGKLKAVDCLPEERNVDACIENYQPVCGQVQIECIKAPCDPIKETFANSCKACANRRVLSYVEGECLEGGEVKY